MPPRERIDRTFADGSTVSGERRHVEQAIRIERSYREAERDWVKRLRAAGIKAAHPDDGWVKRDDNKVHLAYPQFNDGLAVGDLLALGWQDEWRVVRITSTEPPGPIVSILPNSDPWYFHFEPVDASR